MGTKPWESIARGLSFPRCLLAPLATPFYRFLARFSGRRRTTISYHKKYPPPWQFLVLQVVLVSSLVSIVEACSSRSTPKPRPPAPTPRPNITFLTYPCPPAYAAWFCLNGATCFTVKIQDSLLYNCMCAEGYQGSRCEYKDLDGSYMPSQRRFMLETASIAGGATIAVFSAVILCLASYLRWRRRKKQPSTTDQVDGLPRLRPPIFGVRPQGQNLVPIQNSRSSPFRGSNNNVPPTHEPNLLPGVVDGAVRGMPHDRGGGDHPPATVLRGDPPWGYSTTRMGTKKKRLQHRRFRCHHSISYLPSGHRQTRTLSTNKYPEKIHEYSTICRTGQWVFPTFFFSFAYLKE